MPEPTTVLTPPQPLAPAKPLMAAPTAAPAAQAAIDPAYEAAFKRNQAFLAPGDHTYNTPLDQQQEAQFRQWLQQNNVPFDAAAPIQDYDMRGFWLGLQHGLPIAKGAVDPNDGRFHYPDYWKTPYHETFSNESRWAGQNAPHWTDDDKLVAPDGTVLYDDRAKKPEQ